MRRLLAILLCLAIIGPAAAAGIWDGLSTPAFSHIGRENGLPHDIVMDIAQDHDGFIWIATQGGLARWDGYRLRVFSHVEGDAGSLPDSGTLRLLVDESGRLWVAMISGSIARFDAATERFETLPIPGGGVGVPGGLASDGDGGIWVGGTDGLAHFGNGTWQKNTRLSGDVSPAVRCLMRGRDGTLWLCGATKLFRQASGASEPVALDTPEGADPIRSLMEDPTGRLWFGTDHSGIGLLDPATGTRQVVVPPSPSGTMIRELAMAGPDEVWGVTSGAGIIQASATAGVTARITGRDGLRSALGSDTLYTVLLDRSGMLWVGGLGGVYVHPSGAPLVDTVWPALDMRRGPWGVDALGLCLGPADQLWLGTLQSGLLAIAPKPDQPGFVPWADPDGKTDATVFACAVASDGTIFAGQRKGLMRIAGGAAQPVSSRVDAPALNTAGPVRSLAVAGSDLWIGTDAGLYRADLQGTILQHYEFHAGDTASLSNNSIETLLADGTGLWIGTHGGLDHLDAKSGTIERIHPGPAADTLPGLNISSLLRDRHGRLWIGTIGGAGVGVLDDPDAPGPRRFHRIGTAEGMPSLNIGTLLEDAAGRIWVSSTDGLIVIDPETLKARGLGPADGVTIRSYWAHSAVKLSDGTLVFAGLKGLSAAHPERLRDWSDRPPVVVSAVRIGGRAVPARQAIELEPEDRSLQVEFAALDYSAPELNRYAYQLRGYDADWVVTDAEHRLAAYTNLPPGDYTLALRGSNRLGVWTEPPTELAIRVLPAWHQSWWFRLVVILLVLALLAGIVRLRTLSLERNRLELERQVARRTVELEGSRRELERSNATLAASAETLRQLGEIGRSITASLDLNHVFAALCGNIGAMLDADSIAIWLLDESGTRLKLGYGIEKDEPMRPASVPLEAPESGLAQAARERREIMKDYTPGAVPPIPGTMPMITALFGPLLVNDRLLGVLTVQSEHPHAYGERERLAFTSLCAYGATALANAEAHRDLARANAELGRLASKDALTGLANRHHFFTIAAEEIARAKRYQRALSVIVADLDQFKRVNDTFGHAAGDSALQSAALRLGHCLRATDLAARFGGEEFIVLMPETGLDGALQVAERFRQLLSRTDIVHNELSFPITVSIGVAAWLPGEIGIEPAIERADAALYRVKRGGRNAVAVETVALPSES